MTEAELRAAFDVRVERFEHGDFDAEVLLPVSSEALIDEVAFPDDERLPYWAELWPAARALSRLVLESRPLEGRVIELGCGIGLPSLAARHRGAMVVATDYAPEALHFAAVNAERNGLGPLPTRPLDWRSPPDDLGSFDLVLAADLVYEARMAVSLAAALPHLVADGGAVWLADPGRVHLAAFLDRIRSAGWSVAPLATQAERSSARDGRTVPVQRWELRPPARV